MIYPKQLVSFAIGSACIAMVLATSSCQPTQPQASGQANTRVSAEDAGKLAEQERQAREKTSYAEAVATGELLRQNRLKTSYAEAMSSGTQSMTSAAFREAAKHFQQALAVAKELADPIKENDAREKVITAVRSLAVAPAIPEEAHRYGVRGETIMNSAKKAADFSRAAVEFEAAATIAPWWGSAYYNLGLMREGAKDARGAIAAFALFLKAEPDAPEAAAIRDRMYALEVAAEEQEAQEEKAWTGYWTEGVNTFVAEITNGFFVLTVARVDPRDTNFGLAPGQVAFKGKFNRKGVNGKRTWDHCSPYSNRTQCERCIGKVGSYKALALLHRENNILELQFNDTMGWGYNTTRCSPLETHPITLTTYFMRQDNPN